MKEQKKDKRKRERETNTCRVGLLRILTQLVHVVMAARGRPRE